MPPSIASTRPVNPPGQETKITAEQLWKAMELKVRQPELFLPFFTSTDVESDDGTKVVRKAHSKTGEIVAETCYLYAPTMVYFDGDLRVTNVISYDESGNLLLTYSFVNGIPRVGNDEKIDPVNVANIMGKSAVEHTLEVVREMIKAGKL